jgi:hypothetical protein
MENGSGGFVSDLKFTGGYVQLLHGRGRSCSSPFHIHRLGPATRRCQFCIFNIVSSPLTQLPPRNIGFVAGSQQFTATNLQFTSCLTAVFSQWNWGFTWKNIYVLSCWIAFDCTSYSGLTKQGTGSITILDSHFNGVPTAITVDSMGNEQVGTELFRREARRSVSCLLTLVLNSIAEHCVGQPPGRKLGLRGTHQRR